MLSISLVHVCVQTYAVGRLASMMLTLTVEYHPVPWPGQANIAQVPTLLVSSLYGLVFTCGRVYWLTVSPDLAA